MSKNRIGRVGRLAACLGFVLASGVGAVAQRHGVSAEISLDQTIYLADEDMQLKLRVTNRSGQTLALGADDDWVAFSIQGAHNFMARSLGKMPEASPFALGSGMVATRVFNPAPYFEVRKPGRYTISAAVQIPQWNQSIECKAVSFTVVEGTPLAGMSGLEFGLQAAPGTTNAVPETRRYTLVKVAYQDELKLYFKLTDSGGRTLRCYSVGRMLSFSSPEAQLDHFNNLHLLWQNGARDFAYIVFLPDGNILLRQTRVYSDTRPTLKANENGNIAVVGGFRRYTAQDIPSASGEAARQ